MPREERIIRHLHHHHYLIFQLDFVILYCDGNIALLETCRVESPEKTAIDPTTYRHSWGGKKHGLLLHQLKYRVI
jgi:hypothetical protein